MEPDYAKFTNFKLSLLSILFFAVSTLLLSACGSSSGGDSTDTAIGGYVIDGPISGSSVSLHRVNANGSTGEQVAGPFVTDANGEWTGSAPASESVLVVVARGGQYTDDATGALVSLTNDDVMNSWYDPSEPSRNRVVSPITDSLWQIVQQELSEGESMTDSVALAEQV